jgi:hypothetical protein
MDTYSLNWSLKVMAIYPPHPLNFGTDEVFSLCTGKSADRSEQVVTPKPTGWKFIVLHQY